MKRIILVCAAALLMAHPLAAEDARGVVIFAEGTEFTVVRGGTETAFDLAESFAEGTEILSGDFVNTFDSTFIEIQLLPSRSVIRISENTSFRFLALGAGGGGEFEITYGRVRARVERLVSGSQFNLSGPGIVAGVRGTDFGYDLVAEAGGTGEKPVAEIYCFEGSVEVSVPAFAEDTASAVPSVVIGANQMVNISLAEPEKPLETTVLKPEIREFWEEHPFQGSPLEPEDYRAAAKKREIRSAGFAVLAAGSMFEALGVVGLFADIPALSLEADQACTTGFLISGGLLISQALYLLLYSIVP